MLTIDNIFAEIEDVAQAANADVRITGTDENTELHVTLFTKGTGSETCSVTRRKRFGRGEFETQIGWYSSSSNSVGHADLDRLLQHIAAIRVIARFLEMVLPNQQKVGN